MPSPIVIAYHLIWTAYGWWLPNNLRGSSSHVITSNVIAQLGQLHHGRKQVQPACADLRAFYDAAKDWLRHGLLTFDLSVLVGVNDTARPLERRRDADTIENFDLKYRRCLDLARDRNAELRLVICEPFALEVGRVTPDWRPGLTARQRIARKIAEDYRAVFVPFQQLFDAMAAEAPAEYWLPDGMHPTPGAHHRMARLWIEQVVGQ